MAKFTNTGKGPRGIALKNGDTLYLDRNETFEVDKADIAKVHNDIKEAKVTKAKADD